MRTERVGDVSTVGISALTILFFLSLPIGVSAQTAANAQPDIYANFVGVWVGTDKYVENGKEITKTLRLTIQETKKKDGMKWNYIYGTGDQKDDRPTRHVTFHPAKAEIILQWERDDDAGNTIKPSTWMH